MYRILTLNNIADVGIKTFNATKYHVSADIADPDAILVRSSKLHDYSFPETVQVIGRAGVGVNTIPIKQLTQSGIPVLNTPGANANAVKELVITGMLLACRNICTAWEYAHQVTGSDTDINMQIEKQKKKFAGFELPGRTLGVIGLGHIGVRVANAANDLGMRVIGYDPAITVQHAWQLSSAIQQADHIEEVLRHADFISLHIPLNEHTKNLFHADRIQQVKTGAIILNFARNEIVDNEALISALTSGKLSHYVCDFPTNALKTHPQVICLPHLGASTQEAEENCAVMAAQQIQGFLEFGHIKNSVNFPSINMPKTEGYRLCVINKNVPNMVAQISTVSGRLSSFVNNDIG